MSTNIPLIPLIDQLQYAKEQHFSQLDANHPSYIAKQKAWQRLNELGLPHAKTEAYKYTPITSSLAEYFQLNQPSRPSPLSLATIHAYLATGIDAYQLILVNGRFIPDPHFYLPSNLVKVSSFQEAYQSQHPSFLQYAYQYDQAIPDAFAAINTTLFEEGIWIHIHEHAVLDKPLWIYHITDATHPSGINYPHCLITTGRNSQASIINSWHSIGDEPSLTNAFTKIHLSADARLDYYNLQIQDLQHAYQVNTIHFSQFERSAVSHYNFTWNGRLIRNNPYFALHSPHTETHMYGLYCLSGQQHVDNHTTVDHQQAFTRSNELYKGIIAGQATGVFNGRIYVRKNAQKTHAFQANNNLLISDQATMHTKPQLEIWADDVKCSHGATIGQLNENELFYLQARGIPPDTAQHMLLEAFANEVIGQVPLVELRQYLHTSLMDQLQSLKVMDV
jgi:Fe-S cluster assembly protein SufD